MEAREKKWKKKIDSPFRRATEKAHLHGSFAYAERDGGVAMATRLTHIASMFLFVRARACACVCYRVFFLPGFRWYRVWSAGFSWGFCYAADPVSASDSSANGASCFRWRRGSFAVANRSFSRRLSDIDSLAADRGRKPHFSPHQKCSSTRLEIRMQGNNNNNNNNKRRPRTGCRLTNRHTFRDAFQMNRRPTPLAPPEKIGRCKHFVDSFDIKRSHSVGATCWPPTLYFSCLLKKKRKKKERKEDDRLETSRQVTEGKWASVATKKKQHKNK